MGTQAKDTIAAVKQLRDAVWRVLEHVGGGGKLTRQHQLFIDLKKLYRHAGDPTLWALLERLERVLLTWQVLADSMLEAGGSEVTSFAIAVAKELGIELRESVDGGKTWRHVREVELNTQHFTEKELLAELRRRDPGARYIDLSSGARSSNLPPGPPRSILDATGQLVSHARVRWLFDIAGVPWPEPARRIVRVEDRGRHPRPGGDVYRFLVRFEPPSEMLLEVPVNRWRESLATIPPPN